MSTEETQQKTMNPAVIERSPQGEAIVRFPAPTDDGPWRPGRQQKDKIVRTGMFFDDPFAKKKRKPKPGEGEIPIEAPDEKWLFYPRLETAVRIAEYLAQYTTEEMVIEAIHEVTPTAAGPNEPEPPQLHIVVIVNKLRVKIDAGQLANGLIRTTAYDPMNDYVSQQPEWVFPPTVTVLMNDALVNTKDAALGDVVHTF